MLRAGSRIRHHGLSTFRLLCGSGVSVAPQTHLRALSHGKLRRPIQRHAPVKVKQPSTAHVLQKQPEVSKKNSSRNLEAYIPKAKDYNNIFENPVRPKNLYRLLEQTTAMLKLRLSDQKKQVKKCQMTLTLEDGTVVAGNGDHSTKSDAVKIAALEIICKLHRDRLLQQILPGGKYHDSTALPDKSTGSIPQDDSVKIDVIDYAARHGYQVSFKNTRRSGVFIDLDVKDVAICEATIQELGFVSRTHASSFMMAERRACDELKKKIEVHWAENGHGILLVKDCTKLNSVSAEKFIRFYAEQKKLIYTAQSAVNPDPMSKGIKGAVGWISTVTFSSPPTFENYDTDVGQTSDSMAGSPRGPGGQSFSGHTMCKRADADAMAYLAAAFALKDNDPSIWKIYEKEIRRGNGEILVPVAPIDHGLDRVSLATARETALSVQRVLQPSRGNDILGKESPKPRKRTVMAYLPDSQELNAINQHLQQGLARYESDLTLEDLRRKRSELPMVQHRNEVMNMINANDVCVVVGATGSGKTTQLPQLILDELIREGQGATCNIICTQPRRIAAISVAQRVASERNEPLRRSVGYSVRFDSKPPAPGGSIHYCTTGILLKQMQENGDDALDGISHVIVDEVHERDMQIDFLLIVLRKLMADRKAAGKPAIKIILMSATIDTKLFCQYFGQGFPDKRCPHIAVPGRTFPVTSHYLDEIYSDLTKVYRHSAATELSSRDTRTYIDRELTKPDLLKLSSNATRHATQEEDAKIVIDWKREGLVAEDGTLDVSFDRNDGLTPIGLMGLTIAHLLKTTTEGSILVFLPGFAEIAALNKLLLETRPLGVDFGSDSNFKLYMLHSSMPQMQSEVFEKLGGQMRKVILSTNIAETSITIPDVVFVVDSGKVRETQYDRARGVSSLVSAWTAKSNAKQRAGRAGRVQQGHYYTMASQARYESLESQPVPEILRSDLKELVLQISSMGIKDVWGFVSQAVQPPSQLAIESAIDELQSLNALDEAANLTPLGRLLSTLPLSPSIGKMVVLGAIFKCLDPILILAAAGSGKDPFLSPMGAREAAEAAKAAFAKGTGSDQYAVINAFQQWRKLPTRSAYEFAHSNFLHYMTLNSIGQTAEQITEALRKANIIEPLAPNLRGLPVKQYGSPAENQYSASLALQSALSTAGFYPNVAVQKTARFLRTLQNNSTAIHVNSIASPPTVDGRRYGRIDPHMAAPPGTLFSYEQKTQADGQGLNLRGVARTSPLAVMLFGGRIEQPKNSSVITVDGWLPFFVKYNEREQIMGLVNTMDNFLQRTYARLGNISRTRLLGAPAQDEKSFLDEDPAREPLVRGVVAVLDESYHAVNSRSSRSSSRSNHRSATAFHGVTERHPDPAADLMGFLREVRSAYKPAHRSAGASEAPPNGFGRSNSQVVGAGDPAQRYRRAATTRQSTSQ